MEVSECYWCPDQFKLAILYQNLRTKSYQYHSYQIFSTQTWSVKYAASTYMWTVQSKWPIVHFVSMLIPNFFTYWAQHITVHHICPSESLFESNYVWLESLIGRGGLLVMLLYCMKSFNDSVSMAFCFEMTTFTMTTCFVITIVNIFFEHSTVPTYVINSSFLLA